MMKPAQKNINSSSIMSESELDGLDSSKRQVYTTHLLRNGRGFIIMPSPSQELQSPAFFESIPF